MRSFHRLVVAVALAGFVVPVQAAEVDRLLPKDTQGVTTLNVRQILDSALVKKIGLEPLQMFLSVSPAQKFLDLVGFNPLKDLTSIAFASTSNTESDKGLLIAHGTFDVEKCHAKVKDVAKDLSVDLKTHKLGDYTVYEAVFPMQEKPIFIALVDKTTLVAGPSKELTLEALDKNAGKKPEDVNKDVKDLIAKSDAKQSLWLAGLMSSEIAKSPLINDEKTKEILNKVKTLSGGVTLTDDVKIEFNVGAKSDGAAKDIAELIKDGVAKGKELIGLLGGGKKEAASALEVLETVKVSQQGASVTVKGEISKKTIDKLKGDS